MATVVHNAPAERRERGESTAGWVVAIIALLAIVLLFLLAGVFFNNNAATPDTGTGVELNVPESIDVNMGAGELDEGVQ